MPNTLEIKAGDTVRWVNHSRTEPHTVTFLGAGVEQLEDIAVEPRSSGPAYELTFDTPGEHPYYCILHASGPEGPGMAGALEGACEQQPVAAGG